MLTLKNNSLNSLTLIKDISYIITRTIDKNVLAKSFTKELSENMHHEENKTTSGNNKIIKWLTIKNNLITYKVSFNIIWRFLFPPVVVFFHIVFFDIVFFHVIEDCAITFISALITSVCNTLSPMPRSSLLLLDLWCSPHVLHVSHSLHHQVFQVEIYVRFVRPRWNLSLVLRIGFKWGKWRTENGNHHFFVSNMTIFN